jgi:hypothetical protein
MLLNYVIPPQPTGGPKRPAGTGPQTNRLTSLQPALVWRLNHQLGSAWLELKQPWPCCGHTASDPLALILSSNWTRRITSASGWRSSSKADHNLYTAATERVTTCGLPTVAGVGRMMIGLPRKRDQLSSACRAAE